MTYMKTHTLLWLIVAAGACISPELRAQTQVQTIPASTLPTQVLPAQVIYYVPQEQPAPTYVISELPTQAEVLLREARAQHRREYEEAVILHNAKLEEIYRQRIAEMKLARAHGVLNGKNASPVATASKTSETAQK